MALVVVASGFSSCRPRPKTKAIETALDPAAKKPAMIVYAETHSRPDDHDQLPDHGREDGLQGDPVLLEWVRCVARLNFARAPRVGMSNPVPGGSARKSAAIIPFVNESLTHGLPIASTPQFVNDFNSCRSVNDRGG